jgi:hypothetical protein
MNELARFQDLQLRLVKARREGNEAVSTMTVALHHEQRPEIMATLTEIIGAHGFAFTAENETVEITSVASQVRDSYPTACASSWASGLAKRAVV